MSVEVLMSGEESSMVSTWTVYLCLETFGDGQVELSERQYEGLAMCHDYAVENDAGEVDYALPDEIDGKRVVGIDDEIVIGGDLALWDDGLAVRLAPGQVDVARLWLKEQGWDRRSGFSQAWTQILHAMKGQR